MTNFNDLYLPLQSISVPQDNHADIIFDFQDHDGNVLDLTGVQEIKFVIFTDRGGTAEVTKTWTGGDITIFGNDYQFSVPISDTDTQSLTNRISYYECMVTNSSGDKRTVSAGAFRAEKTYIWSIP